MNLQDIKILHMHLLKYFPQHQESLVEFQRKVSLLQAEISEYSKKLSEISNKMPYILEAVKRAEQPIDEISKMIWNINEAIKDINLKFYGDNIKRKLDIYRFTSLFQTTRR